MDLAPDFDEFCALLPIRDVELVIAGAYALAFHGPPRFTGDLHVMSDIDGVTWEEVWASREMEPVGRHEVPFIGRDAFLRNKRAAGRAKDLADIEAVRQSGPDTD